MYRKALLVFLAAAVFASPVGGSAAEDDIGTHPACTFCGMDRGKWDFSRVLIEYDDGSAVGTCSIRCAAVDLALNIDKTPAAIRVADHDTKQLLDAETAVWVIGGKQPGVMTKRAKWAFAGTAAAEAFVKGNEGAVATFDEVVKGTYLDMYEDTRMIRERRAAKRKAAAGGAAQKP